MIKHGKSMEKSKQTREIDIIAAAKTVMKDRRPLAISVIAGIVLGAVIAFSLPKTYTSDVILAPEISAGGMALSGNLADMAQQFGIDLGGSGKSIDAIYPEIYPEILSSDDFIRTLLDVNVRLKDDDTPRTYMQHILKDTRIPFWNYPKAWLASLLAPRDNGAAGKGQADRFKMSKTEDEICRAIGGNIGCLIDKKTSVIMISVTDQDPLAAAIMADTLQQRLQNYITDYRTKKARTDYDYYMRLYEEAKGKYHEAQKTYAGFCDANQDVMLETYIAKRDELENNMQTAFTLMTQMQTQMQAAKAKIQERTPAYTIIKSAKMPHRASSMPRVMILALTLLLALTADALWVLFLKDILRKK